MILCMDPIGSTVNGAVQDGIFAYAIATPAKRSGIHLMTMSGANAPKVVIGQCIRHQLLIQTGCIVVNAHPTLLTADAAAGCAFARNVVLLLG